ncbi:MAG: cadmium-translocating P-type ATPase [Rickettsiales bacterium]|nr:cadmium-translocating P-type ATPase [Rickettsiales bacterium]
MNNKYCLHCNEKLKPKQVDFCCLGCGSAHALINNLGFKKYYDVREISQETANLNLQNKDNFSLVEDISEFVKREGEKIYSSNLMVKGLHCAACVWLIESILTKQKNVLEARINLSRKSLYLKWQGSKKDGNDLVAVIQKIGYTLLPFDIEVLKKEEQKYDNTILKALAVAGFGAGNVMLFSFSIWFSDLKIMGPKTINLLHLFSSLIALPVIIYAIRPFLSSALQAMKAKTTNMDVAISVAIILTTITSTFQTLNKQDHVYFDSALMLIFFLLVGRYLELKARKKAFNIASEFSLLNAGFARVEESNKIKTIPISKIKKGMTILVAPGEKITADGIVISGNSEIDSSIIDGESIYKKINKGASAFAGFINISSPLKILVTKDSKDSLISQIINLSDEIDKSKNKFVTISSRLSKFYTPAAHLIALITFVYWFSYGWENALITATTVLIITCPCALALAVPITQTITISKLIKHAVLVKSGQALENIRSVETIIFDKTGTLTESNLTLDKIKDLNTNKILNTKDHKYHLQLAASLAKNSTHPISKAISDSCHQELFDLKVKEEKGFGLSAIYKKKSITMGRSEFCKIKADNHVKQTSCYLKYGDKELIFLFKDNIKEDAAKVIERLQKMNKKIILLSGDIEASVQKTADFLGIKEYYSGQTPVQKANFLQNLNQQKEKFIMLGDGINDAPSLALADISISFNNASDISKNIADIVIQGQKLMPLITIIAASHKSISLIKQNLTFAVVYNVFAISLAVTGNVTPLIAALSMSASSLIVLLNSLRMKVR